eukprot:scaffold109567_cov66-Phaeocystis_antarctica.AAC.3
MRASTVASRSVTSKAPTGSRDQPLLALWATAALISAGESTILAKVDRLGSPTTGAVDAPRDRVTASWQSRVDLVRVRVGVRARARVRESRVDLDVEPAHGAQLGDLAEPALAALCVRLPVARVVPMHDGASGARDLAAEGHLGSEDLAPLGWAAPGRRLAVFGAVVDPQLLELHAPNRRRRVAECRARAEERRRVGGLEVPAREELHHLRRQVAEVRLEPRQRPRLEPRQTVRRRRLSPWRRWVHLDCRG